MTHPQHAAPATPLVDRFLSAVRRREPKHKIDGSKFVAMLWRLVRALEVRAINDPELLPQCIALAQRLSELVNVAIAANADRYRIDPMLGLSQAECGRILGASKQAASQRAEKGREIMAARIDSAGAVHINRKTGRKVSAETARELEIIERATEYAAVSLAEYRARRAA